MVILQVQIELKGTPCLDKYKEQEKKIQLANKAKEMLLLTATAKSADDSGDVLDDDNDVANLLPDSMNDLNKLMQSAIIAHEKAKDTISDTPVKGKRGASKSSKKKKKKKKKKGTNGGGASAKQTNQNTNKNQEKSPGSNQSTSSSTPSQSNSRRRKRRGRAAAAGNDTNAAKSSSKRQKSVERS